MTLRSIRLSGICVMLSWSFGVIEAAETARTGHFSATFAEASPLSAWPAFLDHAGAMWGLGKGTLESSPYRIADESFDVYVPKSYDGSAAFGLIAFVNSGKGGGPPGGYDRVCDEQKLVWIGGANVPNERDATDRGRLTVDAVFNIGKIYRINPDRVYVSGMSGGGRVASHLAIPYADVFTGGSIFLCGCNPLIMPADPPTAKHVDELAKSHRFALVTGSDDYNKPGTKDVCAQYQGMKLPYVKYFEQAGLGHELPSAATFGEAVTFLDGPLVARAAAQLAAGKAAETKKQWREAWAAYKAAAGSTVAESVAGEAKPLLANAAINLDQDAAKELEKILVKPQATAVRSFVLKWPAELPCATKARGEAERLGGEEYDKLVAAKPTSQVLRTFLKTWEGYDVCHRALETLDGFAKEAWTKVDALKSGSARTKAMAKFIVDWSPTATAITAGDALSRDVQAALTEIAGLATAAAKASRLQALLSDVKGSPSATAVESAFAALVKEAGAKK